jgi:hypothetical protein
MILIIPEEKANATANLLASLLFDVAKLRKLATELRERLERGDCPDLGDAGRKFAGADTLVKNCQKLEMTLVTMQNLETGVGRAGYALDLDKARDEVRGRLDRLRKSQGKMDLPERD